MFTLNLEKTIRAMKKKTGHMRRVITKSAAELSLLGLAFSSVVYSAIPATAFADVSAAVQESVATDGEDAIRLQIEAMRNKELPTGALPESDLRGPFYTKKVTATAYNSEVGQCDSTPFTTASGTTTRWGIIATNGLPMKTKVRLRDSHGELMYGGQIFVVEDRMNPRYDSRIDIWMESHSDAVEFGVRNVTLEVYGK